MCVPFVQLRAMTARLLREDGEMLDDVRNGVYRGDLLAAMIGYKWDAHPHTTFEEDATIFSRTIGGGPHPVRSDD